MRLLRYPRSGPRPAAAPGAVVALGNFDGVHLGHQAVLARAARIAEDRGAPLGVLTFEPHPRTLFKPDSPPFRLTPMRSKARLLDALGVDEMVVLRFDRALSEMSAERFVATVLVDGLRLSHAVVGHDFHFGHGRRGTPALLADAGPASGFGVTVVDPVLAPDGEVYASTRIRRFLADGAPEAASRLLGRPWEIEGRVRHGDRRGRLLGFPTANVELGEALRPRLGVYAVRAGLAGPEGWRWRDGVANIGSRPTVDGSGVRLEAHLFGFDGDLYGRTLRVALVAFLRGERRFDGLDALKAQIAEDGARARKALAEAPDAIPTVAPIMGPGARRPGEQRA